MTSTGPSTRGGARRVNNPSEIIPQSGISLLDEGDGVLFGLLLRPVKSSLDKIGIELRNILGKSGSGAPGGDAGAKPEEDVKTKEQINKTEAERGAQLSAEFSAKFSNGADIKKTGKYILMPLPINISDSLNVTYSTAQLGGLAAGYALGSDASEAIRDGGSVAPAAAAAGNYAIRAALGLIPGASGAATLLTGQVINPFSASVFESVEARTFNFQFNLQAKSPEESNAIREVINLIRFYALPKPNGLLLDVPWEWELAFMGTDYLYAFSRCNLIRLETNYAQNGPIFTKINAPKDVTLNIEFREIFPMNQNSIMNFNNPSMNPSGLGFNRKDNSPTPGAGEADGTDPNTGLKPAPANNEQIQRDKEISNLVSEYQTNLQKIAGLDQQINSTTPDLGPVANARRKATVRRWIEVKRILVSNANILAAAANSKMQESNNTKADGTAYVPLPGI